NAVASCAANDVECYRSNAEAALKTKESSGEMPAAVANKGGMATAMNAAAVAVPLGLAAYTLMTKKKDGPKCKAYSLYAMAASGAALFVGDVLANSQHKSASKILKKIGARLLTRGPKTKRIKTIKKQMPLKLRARRLKC